MALTLNTTPAVIANATATNVCLGNNITLTGSGATSYSWTGGVSNGVAFSPSSSNTYTVTGTASNGCSSSSSIYIFISACTSIQETQLQNTFQITPNPFNNELVLKLENYSDNDYDVVITDILGKTIQKEKINGSELVLKLDNLSSGIYYLSIYNHEKIIGNKKIIKH